MAAADHPEPVVMHRISWSSALRLAMTLVLTALGAVLAWHMAMPIALLIVAVSAAEALDPVVCWVERKIPGSRGVAVTVTCAALALVAGVLVWIFGPILAREIRQLVDRIPQLVDRVQQWADSVRRSTGLEVWTQLGPIMRSGSTGLLELPVTVLRGLGETLVVIFLTVYWLIERPAARRFLLSLRAGEDRESAGRLFDDLGHAMGGYFRGAAINGLVMGVVAGVALWIIGVPFVVGLAVVTALGELIPYLGALITGALAVGAGLLVSFRTAVVVLVLYVVLQQVEGHVLSPNVMRTQTRAPAGVVLFGFTAGFALGGVLGGIAGIPAAAALRVLAMRARAAAREKTTPGVV